MTQPEQVLARILKSGARALAGYAAGETPPIDAETAQTAVVTRFDGWRNVLAARLEEIAVAISTGRPEFFVEQVHWTRAALEARGVPAEMLRARLEALRHVLVEQIPAELAPMATGYIDRALAEFGGEPAGLTPRLSAETPGERLAATYLVAILEGDRRKAISLILRAADEGQGVPDIYLRVLQPAQEELGRMWLLGEINVAEEHFATMTTRLLMAQLHAREVCRAANGKTLVAAAVSGNQHDLGIQVVADLFEMEGWRVIQLGSNVPTADLAQAVEFYDAAPRRTFRLACHAVARPGGNRCGHSGKPAGGHREDPGRRLRDDGRRRPSQVQGSGRLRIERRGSCRTRECARRTTSKDSVEAAIPKEIISKRPADICTSGKASSGSVGRGPS